MNIEQKLKESIIKQVKRIVKPQEPTIEEKVKALETKIEELEKGN